MPVIDGKEYPRLEDGVVLYGPKAEPKEQPKPAPKKKARRKKEAK